MKEFKNVRGTQPTRPLEVEVGPTHAYVRSNIRPVEAPSIGITFWIYDEVQYTLAEYIQLQQEKIEEIQNFTDKYLLDLEHRLTQLELGGA
ncbi:hypothetical protein AAHH17_16380 [Lysinibacillus capsici]|uniref:hypothetical protein n=1 Tax=Lysinibacillus capsici TaxID=2115968 RepID=UPI0032E3EAA2